MSKAFTLIAAMVMFAMPSSAQFLSPVKIDKQHIMTLPRQQLNTVLEQNETRKAAIDSARTLSLKNAKSLRRMPAGPDMSSNLVIDDGTRLRGVIASWGGGPFAGIANLRPVKGTYPESVAPAAGVPSLSVSDGEHYYAFTYQAGGGQVLTATYFVYDAKTFKLEKQINLEPQWYSVPELLAYNPKDKKIWAVSYDGRKGPLISQLDTETGKFTWISQTYFLGFLECMAFDDKGNLYGINNKGEFVTVDLNSLTVNEPIADVASKDLGYSNDIIYNAHTKKFYWTHEDGQFNSSLREIDPSTGNVSIISSLPSYFHLSPKQMILPDVKDEAPNTVKDLVVDFEANGSTKGTINITAPTTTYNGQKLSGQLTMALYVDNETIKSTSQNAGEKLTVAHDFASEGEHKVKVVYTDKAGNSSPEGTITVFCGKDKPSDVANVVMKTNDQTGQTTLTWNAVTTGIHGGYVKPGNMTYTVVRMPDNKVVAQNTTKTAFEETLPNELKRYWYKVNASCNGVDGYTTESNSVVWGNALDVPYKTRLGEDDFGDLCMTENLDGHGDGFYHGWGIYFVNNGYSEDTYQNDKWLYTPGFKLKKGTYYYRLQHEGSPFELTYGKYRNPQEQKKNVIGIIDKNVTDYDYLTADDNSDNAGGYSSYITYKRMINIPEDGVYYFGIHWNPQYQGGTLGLSAQLKNFELKKGPEVNAPIENTIDSVKTFPKGELRNHIWFTTPTKDYEGSMLQSIDSLQVYLLTDTVINNRKSTYNRLVKTVTSLKPGEHYQTDVIAHQGNNIYYLYAYNKNGIGGESECFVWAGIDYPTVVTNPQYSVENNLKTTLKWDAPSEIGQNGGYVDPSKVTYNAGQAAGPSNGLVTAEGGEGLTKKTFTFGEMTSTQQMFYYGVTPVSELGEGQGLMIGLPLGKPYTAPFKESFNFDSGALSTAYWGRVHLLGLQSLNVLRSSTKDPDLKPYDNDGGMWVFEHDGDTLSADIIQTPIFSLKGVKKPVLSFYFHHNNTVADHTAGITVVPVVNDKVLDPIASIGLNQAETGWKHYELPLGDFIGTDRVYFLIQCSNTLEKAVLGLDNMEMYDNIEKDLSLLSFKTPIKLNPNEENIFEVEVRNDGRNTLDKYSVGLYADGELLGQQSGTELAFSKTNTLKFNITPSPVLFGKKVKFEAKALLDGDANEENDVLADTVYVSKTILPSPKALKADRNGSEVKLSWQVPDAPNYEQIRETFEDYEPFIIEGIGDWTSLDRDNMLSTAPVDVNSINTAVEFPNNGGAKAFQVWTTEGLEGLQNPNLWKARVGKKCLIDFAASTMSADYVYNPDAKNDDWFISPRVVGGSTVEFWAHEVKAATTDPDETIELLASYSSQDPSDFELIETKTIKAAGTNWEKVSFALPEDAKYFAIRSVSKQTFALLIDNIDYTPGYSDLTLLGYNIYRDGMKLNDSPVQALTYSGNYDDANEFGVTAVYEDGESDMVTVNVSTGIETASGNGVKVFSIGRNIFIDNAEGKAVRIYNAAGQKEVSATLATPSAKFEAKSGIHIVKVGSESYTIVVR